MRVTPEFTFFFGQEDFLSNWYDKAPFTVAGNLFLTNEHFMMYRKAILFEDQITAQKILRAKHPAEAKKLGREVKNFDGRIWSVVGDDVVFDGALFKFTSSPEMMQKLLDTGNTTLVEASPYDLIWGIGLDKNDPNATDPSKWRGQNKLGKVIQRVRDKIIGTKSFELPWE